MLAESANERGNPGARFVTTHWSVIIAAGRVEGAARDEALSVLCRSYWMPVYAFIRRRGAKPEDAQDLTQEFFARLLEKEWLAGIEPRESRFRSFLLTAVSRFLANEHDRRTALKRGGGVPLVGLEEAETLCREGDGWTAGDSPEQAYDRRWALTVLNQAFLRLEAEAREGGKARQFERLHVFLSREAEAHEYGRLALELGVSAGAIGVAVHRLRQRYREWVRAEVAGTLSDPALADAEMRDMLAALRRTESV